MSCNELCIFLATARMLREDYSAPSQIDAEGYLDATQIGVLQNVTENVEPPPIEAEGNVSPDYLTDAREKISAEQSPPLVVATGQYYITRPGIATSVQEAQVVEGRQPRTRSSSRY